MAKTFVDLFSGCGGFSLGAALCGYKNILSVDFDPILSSSYSLNFPKSRLKIADLAKVQDIRKLMVSPAIKPNLVIGGPPCQGFSVMGKREADDPRNMLLWHYFRHVARLQPNVFMLENVEGLSSSRSGIKLLEQARTLLPGRYKVSEIIKVNASDFGAATVRPRVIVVGYDPEYCDEPNLELLKKPVTKERANVKAAIIDLPSPAKGHSETTEFSWKKYRPYKQISDYAMTLRHPPPKGLGWDTAIDKLKDGFVSGVGATLHSEQVKKRFKVTPQGECEQVSRYFKLDWRLPSNTLRAGTGNDRGSFQAARPIHPTQARVITVREAARLQGFPDWFVFHFTKWHSFRMIGNSVSPMMGKSLIQTLHVE